MTQVVQIFTDFPNLDKGVFHLLKQPSYTANGSA